MLLPGGTNAFQYSSMLQAGQSRGGRGEGVLCRGLLLEIYFMPIVTNAVVFLRNTQCRIKMREDKNPVFNTTAEVVAFQRALCPVKEASWASQGALWGV